MGTIPLGLCQCGCGRPTKLAAQSSTRLGRVKGQPLAFALGHNSKTRRPATEPVFCGCGCGASLPLAKYASHQARYRHGHNPAAGPRSRAASEKRLWDRVSKNGPVPAHRPELGPCWKFTGGGKGPLGHARLHVDGRPTQAHRFAWELENGPIPDGQEVLHRCDNGACVRSTHLFLGTQADNMRDMVQKNRHGWSTGKRRRAAA
jgi:hypothetical protein